LYYATHCGKLGAMELLLQNNANVDAEEQGGVCRYNPLVDAIRLGEDDLINLLLEYGANPNIYDMTFNTTPLHEAVSRNESHIVESLLNNGGNPHGWRYNLWEDIEEQPLHIAVAN
jgi:ankyrin repeat protein